MTMNKILCNIQTTVTVRQPIMLHYLNKGTGVSTKQKLSCFYTGLTLWCVNNLMVSFVKVHQNFSHHRSDDPCLIVVLFFLRSTINFVCTRARCYTANQGWWKLNIIIVLILSFKSDKCWLLSIRDNV